MAMAPATPSFRRQPAAGPVFDSSTNSDDLVRQMRNAASRGGMQGSSGAVLLRVLALVVVNPLGLLMTWSSNASAGTKRLITLISVVWYLVAAALVISLAHLR
jgi:hypothetical protein